MLYWLSSFSESFSALNVFRYITFRAGGAVLTALLFVFLFGPKIIEMLRLSQGKGQLVSAPHLLFFPAGALVLTVLAFVFVGDGLRDALDPKMK